MEQGRSRDEEAREESRRRACELRGGRVGSTHLIRAHDVVQQQQRGSRRCCARIRNVVCHGLVSVAAVDTPHVAGDEPRRRSGAEGVLAAPHVQRDRALREERADVRESLRGERGCEEVEYGVGRILRTHERSRATEEDV